MNKKDIDLIKYLCSLNPNALQKALFKVLKEKNYKPIQKAEYLYAPGKIPVMLVAHLDTVWSTPPTHIFFDQEEQILWSPQGLGADDRAGVYAILKILLTSKYRPHILFTQGEEIGGVGAQAFCSNTSSIPDLKYIIELDRQGTQECVFYLCYNQKFIDYVETFGFETQIGTFTDISIICPHLNVAGVNLSVGYIYEHSQCEHLFMSSLEATIKQVLLMLKDVNNIDYFEFQYPEDYYVLDNQCDICHKPSNHYNLYTIVKNKSSNAHICSNCLDSFTSYCEDCGNNFIDITQSKTICPRCIAKYHEYY